MSYDNARVISISWLTGFFSDSGLGGGGGGGGG